MSKILVTTSSFNPENAGLLFNNKEYSVIFNPYGRKMTDTELMDMLEEHEPIGIIAGTENYTRTLLGKVKCIKVISRCGVGLDTIDLEFAEEKGIQVSNTPNATIDAVKELTIGLIFSAARKISITDRGMRQGKWEKQKGRLLRDLTIGVIGLGRIGTEVAQFFFNYGCNVIAHDINVKECGVKQVTLEELCKQADVITLHITSSLHTRNLINEKLFSIMKDDVILVNTSRGEIVNEDDLFRFLLARPSAHACIDTYKEEPYNGPLCGLENIILTPHIASFENSTRDKMERESVENLVRLLTLKKL